MAIPYLPGDFVPTTNIWDVSRIQEIDVSSPEFKELLIRLYQNINLISVSLNARDSGYYTLFPNVNGQLFFPNPTVDSSLTTSSNSQILRSVIRVVVPCGALPDTTTSTTAHNIPIDSTFTFTRIYGVASNQTDLDYLPLPYASNNAGGSIELSVNATDVIITTGQAWANYDITNVVLEWIQQ